jgi:hypothetical protein
LPKNDERRVVSRSTDVEPADEVDPAVAAGSGKPTVVVSGA